MRLRRVVAYAALIAAFALTVVPGPAGSRSPSIHLPLDPSTFELVGVGSDSGGSMVSTPTLNPAYRSADTLDGGTTLLEPPDVGLPGSRPAGAQPNAPLGVIVPWHYDGETSFYGPGFYGKRTACGLAYTTETMGVAHRTLPCGTMVTFRNPANGRVVTVPVIDRGPYVAGREWDLSGATCTYLGHCYTGPIYWHLA